MKDVRINSWNELHEQLYEHSWKEPLARYRPSFAYRGHNDVCHSLRTTLARLGNDHREKETHLLRNFRKYALHDVAPADASVWTWLALAQHHGLPTRLLDWTHSPYVALHFATDDVDQFGADAVVWCVDYEKTNQQLPRRLKVLLRREGSSLFTAEMLQQAAGSLEEFDRRARREFVLFWEPPSLDDRIVNQYALFSLISRPQMRLDHWLARHPDCLRRIIIPSRLKWEVRDKLDQANINERVLFPGLDGLSRWLKRYYSDRGAPGVRERNRPGIIGRVS